MLMLGREVNTPAQLMFPHVSCRYDNQEEYVSKLIEDIQQAHVTARKTLKSSTKRMKRNYGLRVLLRPYAEGDVVYILDTAVLKGKCKKLCPPWKGPAIIIQKFSAYLYHVRLRNSVFVVNHDQMMPCRERRLPNWVKENGLTSSPADASTATAEIYCIFRKPWDGKCMIQCD
ncbi:hypothetical protein DPMN_092907 [Dreissena polymorpha]|uniref:Uncharacterized protein n=1 Tax=Dreissena polymorpha TaxID=45954 RepID=A0A9D4L308_DREPO|nr:hypothetical protein DPMN_092907 [Dreissena polymorpha]